MIVRTANPNPHVRTDPPAGENEIELSPRTNTAAPRRIKSSDAVRPLRDVDQARRQFDERVREESARLESERAAALALQTDFLLKCERETELVAYIVRARGELAASTGRLKLLELFCKESWPGGQLFEQIHEALRREYLVARLPGWIAECEAELKTLRADIAEFRKEHLLPAN